MHGLRIGCDLMASSYDRARRQQVDPNLSPGDLPPYGRSDPAASCRYCPQPVKPEDDPMVWIDHMNWAHAACFEQHHTPSPDELAEAVDWMRAHMSETPYAVGGETDARELWLVMAEFDRRGAELDRIRRVRCLGHVYSGLQPPEQCGDYAGHEGKCQP